MVKEHTLVFRLVSKMWVVLRAIKVIFVTIIRFPKQVSADGESSGGLRGLKPPVKFAIIIIVIIINLFFESIKEFW